MNSKQDNDQQQDLTEFGGGSAETGTDESNSESTAGVESFSPELFEDPDGAFALMKLRQMTKLHSMKYLKNIYQR